MLLIYARPVLGALGWEEVCEMSQAIFALRSIQDHELYLFKFLLSASEGDKLSTSLGQKAPSSPVEVAEQAQPPFPRGKVQ
jgi:hypothetical protein